MQLGQGDVDALAGVVAVGLEAGDLEAQPLRGRGGLGQLGAGLVDGGLDLDQAGLAGGPAGREVGAEQVTLAGHGDDVGVLGDQPPGGGEVVDDGDLVEQPRHAQGVRRRARDTTSTA